MKFVNKLAAALLVVVLVAALAGCGANLLTKDNTLITLNGEYEITRDMYAYYALNLVANNGSVDWTTEDNLKKGKEWCETELINSYLYTLWAKDLGIVADEKLMADVDAYFAGLVSSYGSESALEEALAKQYYTHDVYYKLFTDGNIRSKLSEKVYAEGSEVITITNDERTKFISEKPVYSAKHILVLANGDYDTALSKINDIKAKLDAGGNFDELMNEYSEDSGLATNPNGYTYTEGTMVAEFEEAVKNLTPGQISEPVKTSYGYHLIMRTEVTDIDAVDKLIIKDRINAKLDSYREKLTVKYANGYNAIKITDFSWPLDGSGKDK